MSASETKPPAKGSSLLRILSFLRKYPGAVALSVSLLLVNIAIEMALPQILGSAITNLRWRDQWGARFDLKSYVLLFVALVVIRCGIGILLGPIRNRLVQRTLGDIRAAIYDAIQRLAFRYHDPPNTREPTPPPPSAPPFAPTPARTPAT